MKITTHVLDTAKGKPAAGVPVVLSRLDGAAYVDVGRGATDADGRCKTLTPDGALRAGTWRLTFDVAAYDGAAFFPRVDIAFVVVDPAQHFHVPLLLSPFSYSTYRGS
jgi:5-hydroxyisourate hydrolase